MVLRFRGKYSRGLPTARGESCLSSEAAAPAKAQDALGLLLGSFGFHLPVPRAGKAAGKPRREARGAHSAP